MVADSPTFIIVELLLNVTITLDFLARVKLEGFRKYLRKSNWNKLDFSICFGCNLLFVVSLVSHAIFEEMKDEPEFLMIQSMAIRTMAKAVYETENIGHYGLGFRYYGHFTSPIRRYADLMIHRILFETLHNKTNSIKVYVILLSIFLKPREGQ
mgnify:CR=1 FL=1